MKSNTSKFVRFGVVAAALTCSLALTAPAQLTTTNIATAKEDLNMDFFPDNIKNPGETNPYRVDGVVTSPDFVSTFGLGGGDVNIEVYIQDTNDNKGLRIFFPQSIEPAFDSAVLELGKKVTVSGFIEQHHGVRDIAPTVPSSQIIIDPAPPVTVNGLQETITNILADAEGFEGTLVTVTNVSIISGNWPGLGGSANITVDDGTGTIILRIDQDTDIDGQPEPISPFNMTGIVTQFDTDTNMPSTGYQVQSRFYTDFEQNVGQVAPGIEIDPMGPIAVGINEQVTVGILGTDQNAGDTLTFDTVPSNDPAGSVVNDLGGRQAEFVWTPGAGFASTTNNVTLEVDDGTTTATTNLDIIVLSAELSSIVINEIHYDPAASIAGDANGDGIRDAREDEFVEVYNNGLANIDISGWTLRAVTNVLYTFPPGTILTGETAVVVFGGVDTNAPNGGITGAFGGAEVLVSVPNWEPGLSNGGTDVNLRDDSGLLIRSFDYSGIGVDDQSITRDPDITGDFEAHSTADGANLALFSPGSFLNGLPFLGSELTNSPPTLDSVPPTVARLGEVAVVNLSASDPNGDSITLSVTNAPATSIFVDNGNGTGSLTYTGALADAGTTFAVEYTASDGGATDTKVSNLFVPSVQYSGLIFNEFLPDPNLGATEIDSNQDFVLDGTQDEFIEIVNNTLADVDLDGCIYSDESGTGGHVFSSIVVPSGGVVVVFGGGSITNFNDSAAQLSSNGNLSLNNGGDTLSLMDPSSNLLDIVVYSDPGVPDAESLTRNPDVTGTTFVMHTALSANPISAGRLANGTVFQTSLAPHVQDIRDGTVSAGDTFTQVVAVAEPDGDVVTISSPTLPFPNASFVQNDNDTGTLTFTPNNSQTGAVVFALSASDTDGADTNSFTINVLGTAPFGCWDFETGLEGWTTLSRLSNADWERIAGSGAEGSSFFMEMDGFGFAVGEPSDDWLISPSIDMSTQVWNQASFYVQYGFDIDSGLLLGLELLASTNYPGTGDPLAGGVTWDDLGLTLPLSDFAWEQQSGGLGAYGSDTNLTLAFRYRNEGSDPGETRLWRVDLVKLGVAATSAPPTINPALEDQITTVGNTVQFTVNATEPDGDLVTLTAQNVPANGTFTPTNGISAANGLFVFTPSPAQASQNFPVTFIASDVDGADTNVVIISVVSSQDGEANLLVSEIMQNPNGVNDSDGEYFEIYNKGGQPIDINGWTISDDGSDSHVINNGGALTVPAKGFAVLGPNSDTGTNGGTPIDYSYGGGWFLSNGADEVILTTPGGVEIDRVEYDGGPNFPDPTGSSMELSHPSVDNNVGANWGTASTSWAGNTSGDNGSPNDDNEGWVPVDTDGDGMSDDYENTHFGGPTNGVAGADSDLDLLDNLGEYLANTDPNDPNSVFQVIEVNPSGSGSGVTLGDTSALRQYVVESSSEPVNPASWTAIGADVMGNNGTTVINDSNTDTNLNYRGKASLP